jgi:molybdopterin-guanine dinucleotide biosynthesis protein A
MTLLGAIIAGGGATRFGGDKGAAQIGGRALIDHVADLLRAQVNDLVIVGRTWAGLQSIMDRPAPDNGPLGGICAALHRGRTYGHEAVLTASCDTLPVPDDLAAHLTPAPAVVDGQWMLGLWPVALADTLQHWLLSQPDRSIRGWMRVTSARMVKLPIVFTNINTREDLDRAEAEYANRD